MNRLIFFISVPLLLLILASPAYAGDCSLGGTSPNFTLSAPCSFAGTVNGVDAGTETINTANLAIQDGAVLTVGNVQTITVGSMTIDPGGTVIIAEGGIIVLKQPLWISDDVDADGDGVPGSAGDGTMEISTTQPSGKVRKSAYSAPAPGSLDCNDTGTNSQNVATAATCYVDGDNDNYGSTTAKTCITQGATCTTATWASGGDGTAAVAGTFATNNTDCNDTGTNAGNVALAATCYKDVDNDNYGASNSSTYSCITVGTTCATTQWGSGANGSTAENTNFASNNTDCNDTGASSVNVSTFATCYVDTDNDGYGSTTSKTCITQGATCTTATWASGTHGTAATSGNFAPNNTDCNDATSGNLVHVSATTYSDNDRDTYTSGVSAYNCLNTAAVASATYASIGSGPQNLILAGQLRGAANGNDCNEAGTNAAYVQLSASCYQDADNDNYGNDTVINCIPAGSTCATAVWGSNGNGTAYNINHAANTSDCCDNNATASPAQTGWFTTAIPAGCASSGTYDWNCSGATEKLYAENGTCYYSGGCVKVNAIVGATNCGAYGTWLDTCTRNPYGAYCEMGGHLVQQQCH